LLSILIATRNRAVILSVVLESYCNLKKPLSGWKIIVVDNGSEDHTREIISSFFNRLPLTYMFEPKLGKNYALNTGLAAIEGDLIVFTDDDVFPHSDWLVQLRTVADTQLEYDMFTGVVLPRWEVPPPNWVAWVDRGPVYTLTDPSANEGPIPASLVFGTNMAIRTKVFRKGTRFDPSIGPRGSKYAMGSETELVKRLEIEGHKAWYVTGAVVEHFISEFHMNKSWVMKRAIRYGRGQYRLLHKGESINRKTWIGIPRSLFRQIIMHGIDIAITWMSFKEEKLFRSRWRFNYQLGQLIEARVIFRERFTGGEIETN